MIVSGKVKIYVGIKRIEFGAFAMVYDYFGMKNTTETRSILYIALNASNETVGFYFMYLYTGNIKHR